MICPSSISNTSSVHKAQLVCTYMFNMYGMRRPVTVSSPFCLQSTQVRLNCGLTISWSSKQLITDSEVSSFFAESNIYWERRFYWYSLSGSLTLANSLIYTCGSVLSTAFDWSVWLWPKKMFIVLEKNSSNHLKNWSLILITAWISLWTYCSKIDCPFEDFLVSFSSLAFSAFWSWSFEIRSFFGYISSESSDKASSSLLRYC